MMKTYQELFNETLTKLRYAISGAVYDDAPLMRTVVKIMYNFSDSLKENEIIEAGQRTKNYGREKN